MKWGVRRYQNPDGSLTEAGRKHFEKKSPSRVRKYFYKKVNSKRKELAKSGYSGKGIGEHSSKQKEIFDKKLKKQRKELSNTPEGKRVDELEEAFQRYNAERKPLVVDKKRVTEEEFQEMYDKAWEDFGKVSKSYGAFSSQTRVVGKSYCDSAMKEFSDLNVAYIQDLGYTKEGAEFINSIISKNNLYGKRVTVYDRYF